MTEATPVDGPDNELPATGKREFRVTVPFTGPGTIAIWCSASVPAGRRRSVGYRVVFEGASGWLDTSQTTRKVIVQGRSR